MNRGAQANGDRCRSQHHIHVRRPPMGPLKHPQTHDSHPHTHTPVNGIDPQIRRGLTLLRVSTRARLLVSWHTTSGRPFLAASISGEFPSCANEPQRNTETRNNERRMTPHGVMRGRSKNAGDETDEHALPNRQQSTKPVCNEWLLRLWRASAALLRCKGEQSVCYPTVGKATLKPDRDRNERCSPFVRRPRCPLWP